MKKLSNKGFSAVEVLLVLVVVGILGGVGWFVWNRQQENKKLNAINSFADCKGHKDSKIQESYPEVCVTKNGKSFPNPDQKVQKNVTYSLPEGWSEIDCSSQDFDAKLAFSNNDKADDCEDRTSTILLEKNSLFEGKCMTADEIKEYKTMKPLTDYSCKKLKINQLDVVQYSGDFGGGPLVSYDFIEAPKFSITYYSDDDGKLPLDQEANQLAQSVKYQ